MRTPEWYCTWCQRWVQGVRCVFCRKCCDPGPLGWTRIEEEMIDNGEMDG